MFDDFSQEKWLPGRGHQALWVSALILGNTFDSEQLPAQPQPWCWHGCASRDQQPVHSAAQHHTAPLLAPNIPQGRKPGYRGRWLLFGTGGRCGKRAGREVLLVARLRGPGRQGGSLGRGGDGAALPRCGGGSLAGGRGHELGRNARGSWRGRRVSRSRAAAEPAGRWRGGPGRAARTNAGSCRPLVGAERSGARRGGAGAGVQAGCSGGVRLGAGVERVWVQGAAPGVCVLWVWVGGLGRVRVDMRVQVRGCVCRPEILFVCCVVVQKSVHAVF